jgi:hypothetical protein
LTRAANFAGLACLPFVIVWLADGFWKAKLSKAAPTAFWIVDIAEWILLPALSLWLLHRRAPISFKDYGLIWPGAGRFVAALFLCTLTLYPITWFGDKIFGPLVLGQSPNAFHYESALGALSIAEALYLAATAALCESVFALGLPWLWFSQGEPGSKTSRFAFMLTASFIFGLAHWESGWSTVSGAFLFQLGALAWYFGLRTLWPIIGAHFLIDLYSFWPR